MDKVFYTLPDDLKPFLAEEYSPREKYVQDHKIINGNRVVMVVKLNAMIYNLVLCSRLHLGIYDDVYNYDGLSAALKALDKWEDLSVEPDGWFRHPPTGRRREYHEDGSLKREWYQP